MDARPQVIILNGVSSVGKTSTAKALQVIAVRPLLHVTMDAFLDMLPPRTLNHADGIAFTGGEDETGARVVEVTTGPTVDRMLRGMRCAVAALAAEGNHLVVDDVLFHEGEDGEYRRLMPFACVRLVALHAPLQVVEARERERGDRDLGLARAQMTRVHRGRDYDLELDSATESPQALARRIRDAFEL